MFYFTAVVLTTLFLFFLPCHQEYDDNQYKQALLHHLPTESEHMEPHGHDVLMGRGGKNNQWCGNEKLRTMARSQAENYRMSSKKGKSYISRELVRRVRELDPPGRFLKKDDAGFWEDVGDEVAREKASQVLRDAVAVGMNSAADASEGELEKDMETLSEKQQRSRSAPPVMDMYRRRRPRDWEGYPTNLHRSTREESPAPMRSMREEHPTPMRSIVGEAPTPMRSMRDEPPTPMRSMPAAHYQQQPMYHSSSKRRRYYENAWIAYEQQENQPLRHPTIMYGGYPRYTSHPMQNASYRHSVNHEALPSISAEPVDDFDLFNGELLRSDTESPDMDTSGSF